MRALELPEDAVRYYFLKEEEDFVLGREYLEAVRVFGAEAGGAAAGHKSGITTGEAAGGQKSGITTGEAAGGQEAVAEGSGIIDSDRPEYAAMAFLACPNNPNGRLIDPEFLKEIIDTCEESGVYLVLDECFLDFADRIYEYRKMLASCEHPHLIRVGAYTKICAIPGVRLGYAMIRDSEIRERIKRQLPEWNMSAFAQAAGSSQYDEAAWIEKTQEHLRKEREYLQGVFSEPLIRERIRIYPSEANYMMLRTEIPLYEKMLEMGILIRDCSDYPGLEKGYYRIAVKTHMENRIFAGTLRGIVFKASK